MRAERAFRARARWVRSRAEVGGHARAGEPVAAHEGLVDRFVRARAGEEYARRAVLQARTLREALGPRLAPAALVDGVALVLFIDVLRAGALDAGELAMLLSDAPGELRRAAERLLGAGCGAAPVGGEGVS